MATLTKAPPKRSVAKKGTTKRTRRAAPPQARFVQRARYWLRHPLNAAWAWLSSVRTAILVIAALVVICLLGIYFQQAPGEVLNDPTAYASWVQVNELPRYGSLSTIFDWLRFYTIFSSWYFMLLLVLLALNILVGGMLNRLPAIWQNFRHPLLKRSERFYESALERAAFERDDAVAWTTQRLRARGYRVRSLVEPATAQDVGGAEQGVTYLYANRNSWATLSTFVFHAALITLLLAGAFSQWHGFAANSPARNLLPAPLVKLSDNLAGFTFDQALPNGSSATVYPRGTPHNISFRTNSFTAKFDPQTGIATDYVTDLSVYQDGLLVAHSNHLRVNDPLAYGGVVFHQSSLIPAVNMTLSDGNGCLICNQSIVLSNTKTVAGLQVDLAQGIPIADTGYTLSVLFPHAPNLHLAQVAHPNLIVTVDQAGQQVLKNNAVLLAPGKSGTVNGNWKVDLTSASEATVLLVTKDSGSTLIWPAAIILILSLCVTFYFPQKRIWVKIVKRRVQLAALREHFVTIRTDLLAVEKASRADTIY